MIDLIADNFVEFKQIMIEDSSNNEIKASTIAQLKNIFLADNDSSVRQLAEERFA